MAGGPSAEDQREDEKENQLNPEIHEKPCGQLPGDAYKWYGTAGIVGKEGIDRRETTACKRRIQNGSQP